MPAIRLRRPPPRRLWAALLVLALLLTQALGSLHRVAHAHGPQEHGHAHVERSLAAGLFDAHHDAADCKRFDQLAMSEAALSCSCLAAEAPPHALAARVLQPGPASAVPADCRVRGPPQPA
jgi:hypothetical protein